MMKTVLTIEEGATRIKMAPEEAAALAEDLKAVATKKAKLLWKRQRKEAYPPIGDALDAFWHSLDVMKDNNPSAFIGQHASTKEWYLACRKVKQDIPKPAEE